MRQSAWLLTVALLLLLVGFLRVALSHWIPSPYIITDELLYTKLARSLAEQQIPLFRGEVMNFPALLYPLLLVPAYLAPDPEQSFRLAQWTNALLMTSAGLPLALLARRLLGGPAALPVTLLVMLAPYTLYSNVAMSENAFFPIVIWTGYLTVRCLEDDRGVSKAALGVVLGLGFLAKPHGLLLPVALGAALLVDTFIGKRPPLRRLASFWPTGVVLAAFLVLHVLKTHLLLGSASWLDLASFFGSYASGFSSRHPFELILFLRSAVANASAIAASMAVAPAVLYMAFLVYAFRHGTSADRAFAVFSLTLGVLLIGVTARHTILLDDPSRIHERYGFHVAPLVLMGGVRALQLGDLRRKACWVAIGLLALSIPWAAVMASPTPYIADTPSLSLFSGLVERLGMLEALVLAVPFIMLSAYAVGWALLKRQWRTASLVGAVYSLMLSGTWGYAQHHSSETHAAVLPLVHWVNQHSPADKPLALVSNPEQFKNSLVIEFYTRLPSFLYYVGSEPIHGANDRSVELTPSGEMAALSRLPEGSRILVPTSYRLNLPVVSRFEDLVLYEKRGPVLLSGVWP